MSIPDSVAKTGVPSMADGSMRSQRQMAMPLLGRGGDGPHLKIHMCTYPLYTHRYICTGVQKVQMRMALVGAGRWHPLMDSLWRPPRMAHPAGKKSTRWKNLGNTEIRCCREIGIVSALWKWTTSSSLLSAVGKIQSREQWIPCCVCLFVCVESSAATGDCATVTVFLINLQTERRTKRQKYPESWGLNSEFCLNKGAGRNSWVVRHKKAKFCKGRRGVASPQTLCIYKFIVTLIIVGAYQGVATRAGRQSSSPSSPSSQSQSSS